MDGHYLFYLQNTFHGDIWSTDTSVHILLSSIYNLLYHICLDK